MIIPNFRAYTFSGHLKLHDEVKFNAYLREFGDCEVEVIVKKVTHSRTSQQNRAMHLYFTQLADELNQHGLDMRQFIKVDVPFNATMVKELIWKPVQKALYGKRSTTQLDTNEVSQVHEIIHREIVERTKGQVDVPFPSIEELFR